MPVYNYVASAQQATIVTHALLGNFMAPSTYNLIIAKCSRIEVHTLEDGGVRMHSAPAGCAVL